jgi:hypothetical protein
MPKFRFVVVFFFILFFSSAGNAFADFSCSISAGPSPVTVGTNQTFTLQINNTGTTTLAWAAFTPDGNFSLIGYSGDWLGEVNGGTVYFHGGSIGPSESISFGVIASVGSNEGTGTWSGQGGEAFGGELLGCGSAEVTIQAYVEPTAPPTIPAPAISNVSVTIGATSATIAWSTDVATAGLVNYGTTSGYGSTATTSEGTSHSVSLSGLSSSTAYHYQIQVTGTGGTTSTTDNTFTTSAAGTTTTTTTTATTATTTTTRTTTTARILKDTVAPSVSLNTDFSKPFAEAPKITGKSSDSGAINVGVAKVEYSIDDGKNWLPVDSFEFRNSNFEFVPVIFEDGNYRIKVRAKDNSGNIGYSSVKTMVIDRLPPQVGGALFSIGPQILFPTGAGDMFALPNVNQKITLSAVGGPITIDILTRSKSSNAGDQTHSLVKNSDSGLWSGILNFSEPGIYNLTAKAIDGAENETERKLNTIVVLDSGKIVAGNSPVTSGNVTLWYFDNQTQRFVVWDGVPYGQLNPESITKNGEYGFFAPAGKYYLEVKSSGFKTLRTEIFTLETSMPVTPRLNLEKSLGLHLGPFTLSLPDFSVSTQDIDVKPPTASLEVNSANVIGNEFPNVDLFIDSKKVPAISFRSKPSVFSFLSTWSPYISQQLKFIAELSGNSQINVVPIMSQESSTFVSVFSKRGEYSFPIYSDPDGLLVKPLDLSFLPTNVFVDRKGIVQKVKVGILTKDELLENMVN